MTESQQAAAYKIDLQGVTKRYPTSAGVDRTVLNNISLRVRERELVTLVGPSGCGKSTLFRMILGSEQPSAGRVMVDGKLVTGPGRDRGIVYQKYSLFPHRTVLDNIIFGLDLEEFHLTTRLRLLHVRNRRRAYRKRAMEYLERMNLAEAADKFPHQLSGGMMQRVAIAQAAIMEPAVLLMDEPFGALDDTTRHGMQLFLLELWQRSSMTVLFVTHDLSEALILGTRVLALSQYWEAEAPVQGSKIVVDKEVPGGHPRPGDFKYSEQFGQLVAAIRHGGLDPDFRQHIEGFDLTHPDALVGS